MGVKRIGRISFFESSFFFFLFSFFLEFYFPSRRYFGERLTERGCWNIVPKSCSVLLRKKN